MTLKKYLAVMSITTGVCWVVWSAVLLIIDPEVTNWIGFFLFYSSLLLALVGTFALLGFWLRFIMLRQQLVFRLVKDAFRQSFFFSLAIVGALLLLAKGWFNWLNLLLLIIGLSFLEFFVLSYRQYR
ncbi:hypothetical protein D6821_00155 [Candidatus Parcubacteria bacterium]|nr:MAG: hypothetical protein D6821_00155 [Candidatus Parcubacteria bacterium]